MKKSRHATSLLKLPPKGREGEVEWSIKSKCEFKDNIKVASNKQGEEKSRHIFILVHPTT